MLVPAAVTSLVVWRVYRRVRRNIGRQPFQPHRLTVRIGIFALISVLVVGVSVHNAQVLMGIASGLLAGMGLAWLGLRLTRFESNDAGHFYTPNRYFGLALSLLMVGRVVYRFTQMSGSSWSSAQSPPAQLVQSPLTMCILGLLAGYYIVYSLGVLVQCRKLSSAPAVK